LTLRALIDQSLQSIIGATLTRRSSKAADFSLRMPISPGFFMLRVSAGFLANFQCVYHIKATQFACSLKE